MTDYDNRPKWICFKNFLLVLNCKKIQDKLALELHNYIPEISGYKKNQKECKELSKRHFPLMLDDLRIFNIVDTNYWKVLFCGVIAFLFIEIVIFFWYELEYKFPFFTDVAIIITLLLLIIIVFLALKFISLINKPLRLTSYSVPVFIVSLGLIVLNFVLINNTGWTNSPFLPAFFFIVITITTAPRENSKTVKWLTFISFVFMILPYVIDYMFIISHKRVDYGNLSVIINILTLFFTVGITTIARHFSSQKIINQQ